MAENERARKAYEFPPGMLPRDFLRLSEFLPDRAQKLFPNARGLILGGLFVSHAGIDRERIEDAIISPVVHKRLPGDGYFLHSQGHPDGYKQLIQAALHWCDKFMVVISERSISNTWVQAEVEWALERSRPIIAVRLDRCGWDDLIGVLRQTSMLLTDRIVPCFDFSGELESAQNQLAITLDELLAKLPRGGTEKDWK
jgi:hypothetical protein